MTKRYTVEQVARMLGASTETVRGALDALAARRELSAETFLFAQSAWRVAPSDVGRIQVSLRELSPQPAEGKTPAEPKRRIVKRVRPDERPPSPEA